MNGEQIRATLETHIQSNWSLTPVAFENTDPVDFSSSDGELLPDQSADYIELNIDISSSPTVTVPADCVRHTGFLLVTVWVREDTGSRQAQVYMDELEKLLSYRTLDSALRVKGRFGGSGTNMRNGWVAYACQWEFETEMQLPV